MSVLRKGEFEEDRTIYRHRKPEVYRNFRVRVIE